MYKVVSIAILIAGIVLAVFGAQAVNSTSSSISRFFTGAPTDKSMEMLISGIVLSVVGLAGIVISRQGSRR